VPNLVKPRVEDAMNCLRRGRRVSTLGDGEGIFKEVGAVEELRGVEGDTIVVRYSLVLGNNVWGDSCGSRVHAEREMSG
jgi:hypothetical protein